MTIQLAAIDFGTTYSGYAFSVTEPGCKLQDVEILANQLWQNAEFTEIASLKTPTCLLLNKDKELEAFGYEAEDQYTDIVLDGEEDHYYFFHRFKMELLLKKNITPGMFLQEVGGKKLSAIEVFGLSIKALRDHLQLSIVKKNIQIDPKRTKWVLTVPAIWTDRSKQFMRQSAVWAGIPNEMLQIALEPEAASIYCQTFPSPGSKGITKTGSKYVVVDIGGGTVDITVHEKLFDGKLKELVKPRGADCGGTSVDKAFYQLMIDVFGQNVFSKLQSDFPSCHLSLLRCFENVKRTIHLKKKGFVNITIPYVSLSSLCNSELHMEITNAISVCSHSNKLRLLGDKLRINASFALSLFRSTSDKIVQLIKSALYESRLDNIEGYILLVGSFSECCVIHQDVQAAFQDHTVIVEEDPGAAVLKGAVLFGYKSDYISSRVARYTYGINTVIQFDKNKHAESRKCYIEGIEKCKNSFDSFMKVNTNIRLGHKIEKSYFTAEKFQKSCHYQVYYTDNANVKFIDEDDCNLLGEFTLNILNPTEHFREMKALFHFGDTEFSLTAVDVESSIEVKKFFEIKD